MRGTRVECGVRVFPAGLIPTYAGNTVHDLFPSPAPGAHPHVCGEHITLRCGIWKQAGSSPRMRGTLRGNFSSAFSTGLIPTYAGNTLAQSWSGILSWAHPHVCGEHYRDFGRARAMGGSSPRMRGTLDMTPAGVDAYGLIPTYAGNTTHTPHPGYPPRAHPHVCGEHNRRHGGFALGEGSSPRMRGTPVSQR